jgi:chitin synthase
MKNIAYLCSLEGIPWGENSWKEIVVVIVADGLEKIDSTIWPVWNVQGIFMDGIDKSSVNGMPVIAHMYEYTTQLSIDKNLNIMDTETDDADHLLMAPCQTILLIKQKNARKINSHRWFFNAICKVLDY